MFFFMLFLLGLDSEFALLETVLTAFYYVVSLLILRLIFDEFFFQIPSLKRYKPIMTFLLCMSCFLISLPCMSYSGMKLAGIFTFFSTFKPVRRSFCIPNYG